MSSEGAVEKRAKLVASRVRWSNVDLPECVNTPDMEAQGSSSQYSVSEWLTTTVTEEDAKHVLPKEPAAPMRRNPSSEDDLALGVEAALYGKQGVKTVQEFLRSTRATPTLSRWNSFNSTTSTHSGPLSVMDVLDLWNDDPEELLLDLGFGCDEPDISGRIPARFINNPSRARGINIQVFLEAQKNRLDLENPDVSNRFRELEVLQQVTTAFSSLVGGPSSSSTPLGAQRDLPAEARERRRRMGMLFRRASKKSLHQVQNPQEPAVQTMTSHGDKKGLLKRARSGLQEGVCLTPLAEEQGPIPDYHPQSQMVYFTAQEGTIRLEPLKEGCPLATSTLSKRKRSPGPARDSFEMEEIHSFDESSIAGSYTGGTENTALGIMRTNSCQSDSSGFLEEPFIPSLIHQSSPGPELIKALAGLSGGSTDSQTTVKEASSPPPSPTSFSSPSRPLSPSKSSHLPSSPSSLPASTPTSPGSETVRLSSPSPSPPTQPSPTSPSSSARLPKSESTPDRPEEATSEQAAPEPVFDSPPRRHSVSPESMKDAAHPQSPSTPTSPVSLTSPDKGLPQPGSARGGPEETQREDEDAAPRPSLSAFSPELEGKARSPSPSPSPSLQPPALSPSPSPSPDSHRPSSFASVPASLPQTESSPLGSPENTQQERSEASPLPSVSPGLEGLGLSGPHTDPQTAEEPAPQPPSASVSSRSAPPPSSLREDLPKLSRLSPASPTREYSAPPSLPSATPEPDDVTGSVFGSSPEPTEHSVTQEDDICRDSDRPCHNDDNTASAPDSPVQDVIRAVTDHLPTGSEDIAQRDGGREGRREGEVERATDTVQTTEDVVYAPDADCSAVPGAGSGTISQAVCDVTGPEPQVYSCVLHDDLPGDTKRERSRKFSQEELEETEIERRKTSVVSHDDVPETNSRTELEPKASGPIEIESLDQVFETSVDCSDGDGEYGDVDAICRELDSDGHVYWAEPIQLSTPSPLLEQSGSFEASGTSPGTPASPTGKTALDSSTGKAKNVSSSFSTAPDSAQALSPNATLTQNASLNTPSSFTPSSVDLSGPGRFRSKRSVSVQMPSFPSSHSVSHIVNRKDVPYTIESKPAPRPNVLALDTSSPLRAIQSWTDLQLQRNRLYRGRRPLRHREAAVKLGNSGMTQRPTGKFSSTPSFPSTSNGWQSRDSLPASAGTFRTKSVSLDTGLWPDEEDEEVERGTDELEQWEGALMNNVACCCSCDHRCTCCTQNSRNKQPPSENFPYSLDELEGMMCCLRQFRSVLMDIEDQVSDDQASVFNVLSDADRDEVRDIAELRRAVKQEAGQLELQLNELAHHYDDSFKMKMHRLLDEQSLLCSQLRLLPPKAASTSSDPVFTKTVATQCCLLPWLPLDDAEGGRLASRDAWGLESARRSLPGSEDACQGLGCSPTKSEKLDFVGFLQRLKESLRHSVNTDSLE